MSSLHHLAYYRQSLTNSPVTVQQLTASQICQLPNLHPSGSGLGTGYIHPIFYCHFTMHSFAIQYVLRYT